MTQTGTKMEMHIPTWLFLFAIASGVYAEEAAAPAGTMTLYPIVWERVVPELEKIRVLEDRRRGLPLKAWIREDQGDVAERINKLLDETVELLSFSRGRELREAILGLQDANRLDQEEIVRLKEKKVSAPVEALWRDTVAEIDEKIAWLVGRIAARDETLSEQKRHFASELRLAGLPLSDDQVEFLLSTVVGDNVIDICIVFYNVKLIAAELEKLTGESLENMQVARRYYGMYTVLLKALLHIYEQALEDIDGRYIPEIKEIMTRTRALMKETTGLLSAAAQEHRAALQANLQAQEFTGAASETYQDYLVQQRDGLRAAREKLVKDLAVAENTYDTVQISGDLLAVMRASEELFDLLFELQVPELRPFENMELKREFDRLTDQLRYSEGF